MSSYHDQRVTVGDGTDIAWSRRGSGAPIVLVHGITENARSFEPITDKLVASHEIISLDLRGHGESETANTYDLASMVSDVVAVVEAADVEVPLYVGHSLGGAVVTVLGATVPYHGILCIDQSLQLDAFKDILESMEPQLRDPSTFQATIEHLFDEMASPLEAVEVERLKSLRRADQDVVLGVWDLIFTESAESIAATIDEMLSGYERLHGPPYPEYIALHGNDIGDQSSWTSNRIPGVTTVTWQDHGHYPHLEWQRQAVNLITMMRDRPFPVVDVERSSHWRAQI